MVRWISADLRDAVAQRARLLCEYCLIAEADTFYGCEVDHIISLKHGGSSESEISRTLALSATELKDPTSDPFQTEGKFTRFFNPRVDRWSEHFRLDEATIHPGESVMRTTFERVLIAIRSNVPASSVSHKPSGAM